MYQLMINAGQGHKVYNLKGMTQTLTISVFHISPSFLYLFPHRVNIL